MNKPKVKKILNIIVNIVLIIFLVICLLAVTVTIVSSKNADGAAEIFGYQMRVVTTGSMEKSEFTDVSDYDIKSIPIRSMIFIQNVPEDANEAYEWYEGLREGDVLTFKYVEMGRQVTITHRIIQIEKNAAGGFVIDLRGDNMSSENGAEIQRIDTSVPNNTNFVIGKVVGKSVVFGNIISLMKSPLGIILLVIVPCFIIIVYEAFKIYKTLQEDKKSAAKQTLSEKEREIEELKKKLAEASAQVNTAADVAENERAEEIAEDSSDATENSTETEMSVQDSNENESEVADN